MSSVAPRRPLARLAEGEIGYFVDPQREDDCLRAAIATATQIPVDEVPDLRLHERLYAGDSPEQITARSWRRIARWADARGLRLVFHEKVPAARRRWIGICPDPGVPDVRSSMGRASSIVYSHSDEQMVQCARADPFRDHCIVLSHGRIIFDPAASANIPRGMRLRTWRSDEVAWGISFDQHPRRRSENA